MWQWSFLKPFSEKGSCSSSGGYIVLCNIVNTCETAAKFFHTDIFTKVYLTIELLSSSCVYGQSVSGMLCVYLEY